MNPQKLTEALKNYRANQSRCAYLQSRMEMLERFMKICMGEMIEDQVTMSQALTGMPHGNGSGDPVGRLAIDIASGKVSEFVKQIQEDMEETNRDLLKIGTEIRAVEFALSALSAPERTLIEMKMIDDYSWAEIVYRMKRDYSNRYSKRTLQRLCDRTFRKACEIVK